MSNKNKLTDRVEQWFKGQIKFFNKWILFWEINIKVPLKWDIACYMFLFEVMKDQFKDKPDLKIWRFAELFEKVVMLEWLEEAEKQIMEVFWDEFTIKINEAPKTSQQKPKT